MPSGLGSAQRKQTSKLVSFSGSSLIVVLGLYTERGPGQDSFNFDIRCSGGENLRVIVKTIGEEARSTGKLFIFVAVVAYLWVGVSPFQPFVFSVMAVVVVTGILLIKNTKLGILLNFVLPILVPCFFFRNGLPDKWWQWVVIGCAMCSLWGDWRNFLPILKGKKTWDDLADGEEEGGKNESLISIVLLQRQPRSLDPMILKQMLGEAWGGQFDDENEDQFVTGEDPVYL